MRDYICEELIIDGRKIPYTVVNAHDYFIYHDEMSSEQSDSFCEEYPEVYELVTQIIALKQSCFLLRHTTYSCQSLSDHLYSLKKQLIKQLSEEHGYVFDDEWMESLVPRSYDDIQLEKRMLLSGRTLYHCFD